MWKEKYEALKKEFEAYRNGIDSAGWVHHSQPFHVLNLNNGNFTDEFMDALICKLLLRAEKDPALLQVFRSYPEIQVKRERRTLQMSDTETPGRIAVLIAEKFFDSPQNSGHVTKEFKRRGWFSVKTSNAAVLRPLADIAEMGFLTRDGSNYQAVPGMKINIVEA